MFMFDSPKLLVSRSDREEACCCVLIYICAYAHKIIHHSNIHERTHTRTRTPRTHIQPWAARQFYLWNATAPKQHFRPFSIPPLIFLTIPFFLFRRIFGVLNIYMYIPIFNLLSFENWFEIIKYNTYIKCIIISLFLSYIKTERKNYLFVIVKKHFSSCQPSTVCIIE